MWSFSGQLTQTGSYLRTVSLNNDSPFAVTGLAVRLSPGDMAECDPTTTPWQITESDCTDVLEARGQCSVRIQFNASDVQPGCYAVSLEASSSGDAAAATAIWADVPSG